MSWGDNQLAFSAHRHGVIRHISLMKFAARVSNRSFTRSMMPATTGGSIVQSRLAAYGCALLLMLTLAACNREPKWRGSPMTPPLAVPALSFKDSTGASTEFLPTTAKASLVFFGYTNCPDVCPTTLADWSRVKGAIGNLSKQVQFVFVSVDPERDTPAVAQRYATQFDPSFRGLSGDSATNAAIQGAFHVAGTKEASASATGYLVAHPAQAFLVDEKGQVRVSYAFGAGWDVVAADIKELLR